MDDEKIAAEIANGNEINRILSLGVRDMPRNPASCGYTAEQIRAFYYRTEEEILKLIAKLEESNIKKFGIFDDEIIALKAYEEELANAFEDYVKNTNNEINNKLEVLTKNITETIVNAEERMQAFITDTEKKVDEKTAYITKNTNNIKALFNLQLDNNVLVYENAELTEQVQKTGGTGLEGLTILDNSYCTVNKVSGASVASKNLYPYSTGGTVFDESIFIEANTTYYVQYFNSTFTAVRHQLRFFTADGTKIMTNNDLQISSTLDGYFQTATGMYLSSGDTTSTKYSFSVKIPCYVAITVANNGESYVRGNCTLSTGDYLTDYEPYFAGFKNAQFKGIKSTGKNLFVSLNSRTPKTYIPTNISENDIYRGLTYTGLQSESAVEILSLTKDSITYAPKAANSYSLGLPINVRGRSFLYIQYETNVSSTRRGFIMLDKDGEIIDNNVAIDTPNSDGRARRQASIPSNAEWYIIIINGNYETLPSEPITISNIQITTDGYLDNYEPYTESVMTLPETVELGEYDYWENSKKVVQTIIENFDSSKYDETAGTYNGTTDFILTGDRSQVAYKGTATNVDLVFDNKYLVWNNGSETVLTPTDESGRTCFDYGANTTEENSYYVIVGGNVL